MENILVVFNNRNDAMQFASILKRMGIRNKTMNTPRELSVSCGISVVFGKNNIAQVKSILSRIRFSSTFKFYLMKSDGVFSRYQNFNI